MWEFFEDCSDGILIICGFIAFITGMCALVETNVVGWHAWSIFFVFSVVLTIFYCVGVVAIYTYRSYVFDEYHHRISEALFSSFISVITTLYILVCFYAISGILFTIALLLVVMVGSVILFAVWHKYQINLEED